MPNTDMFMVLLLAIGHGPAEVVSRGRMTGTPDAASLLPERPVGKPGMGSPGFQSGGIGGSSSSGGFGSTGGGASACCIRSACLSLHASLCVRMLSPTNAALPGLLVGQSTNAWRCQLCQDANREREHTARCSRVWRAACGRWKGRVAGRAR
jgi:hypothetical protein